MGVSTISESSLVRFFQEQLKPYNPTFEPQPLRLDWTLLLILSIAFGYFMDAIGIDLWLALQANWIRRATGRTLGLRLAIWNLAANCVLLVCHLLAKIAFVRVHFINSAPTEYLFSFAGLAILALYMGTVFTMRNDLEDEPIGLPLGGVMTFFFAPYYFQYWLQDYVFTRLRSPSLTGVPAISPKPSQ